MNLLIEGTEISENERAYLLKAKSLFEVGEYLPAVVHRMEITFRPIAVRRELTPDMAEFYAGFMKILRETLPLGSNPAMLQGMPL